MDQQNKYSPPPGDGQYNVAYSGPPQQTTVVIQPATLSNPPKDHLALSVFVCLFCCWPCGIVAIIKAFDTRNSITNLNQPQAQTDSKQAYKWSMISLGFGIAGHAVWIILLIALAATGVIYSYRS